ncbi:MAG TPA: hypothetical protein VFE66_10285 [Bacteroidales bacterium]|nr:hypothetical protein [Bacteroidales bacterium]
MKLSGVPSGLIVLLIFFTACSASKKINEKLIVGNWNRDKIVSILPTAGSENYSAILDSLGVPFEVSALQNEAGNRKIVLVTGKSDKLLSDSEKEEKFAMLQSIFPDFKNTIEFKTDKKIIISTQKTLINGTWKMNGNGNKITLSIQDVSAPMILTLVKINSTTMEIVDHFPNSDFQMLYKKH